MAMEETPKPEVPGPESRIIHRSRAMQEVLAQVQRFAKCDLIVLIEGETGTGKEEIANEIHRLSARAKKHPHPVVFSCSVDEALAGNELFGHAKGAYTGADESSIGLIESANGGTLFLDDIDDMPLAVQKKFLRVLEQKKLSPLGTKKIIEVDVRVIAATKINLQQLVNEHKFRSDLFYRLNILVIKLPRLRDRVEDISLLASHFIGNQPFTISPEDMREMEEYHWPGNVRQLKNVIERAIHNAEGPPGHLRIKELINQLENPHSIGDTEYRPSQRPPSIEDLTRFVNEFNAMAGHKAAEDPFSCARTAALKALGLPSTAKKFFRDARSIARWIQKTWENDPGVEPVLRNLNPFNLNWLLDIHGGRRRESSAKATVGILRSMVCPENRGHGESNTDLAQPPSLYANNISIALPTTGPYLFGREQDLQRLLKAWEDQNINIVMLVAFGGVGKSTLLAHWLHEAMRKINYGGAQRVYARSFYRQTSADRILSADVFIADALSWFGDSDPKAGYPGEKGERLARLLKTQRTLLIMDGLEVVQFPPGFQEGKLRDEGLRVLLRDLAASNPGLCVISTRLPVADLRDFETSTVQCIKLGNLSNEAGALFLRVLGVKGRPEKLEQVAQAFEGHSLALSLLGNYLRMAHHGDVERVNEISLLEADAAQGGHAFRVMESYATWLEAPEQAVLRMIGLFDHAADPTSISVLRRKPFIPGLEEASEQLKDADWQIRLSNLRDTALLADSQPDQPEDLEAHPLVRDFFGAQFQRLYPEGWREAHRRLYEHLKTRAKEQPETSTEMGPLFAAVAHGCKAGLHEQVLEEVYKRRLMRGEARYASSKLAAFGPLLSALSNFFEHGNWTQPVPALSANARMYVLNQAASYLSITKGFPAPEARVAYELAKREAETVDSVPDLFSAVRGLWRCHHVAAEYEDAWGAAHQLVDWSVKTEQPIHVAEAYFATGATAYYLGKLNTARRNLERAIAAYGPTEPHSGMGGFDVRVASLSYLAWTLWYLGFPETATKCCNEALIRARYLSDQHTLALSLHFSAYLAHCCGNCDSVRAYARELSELSGRYGFVHWLACGTIMQGCASVMQRQFDDGISRIREGLEIWKSASAKLGLPNFTGKLVHACGKAYEHERDKPNLLAEAFALVDDALTTSAKHKERYYNPDLYRIKGELTILAAPRNLEEPGDSLDAEKLFQKAIELARTEHSKSLELRAVKSLSRLLILTQRKGEAREMLSRILEWFSEGHDTADHVQARNLLDHISHGESDLTTLPSTL